MTTEKQTFPIPTIADIWADVPPRRVLAGGKIGPHTITIYQVKGVGDIGSIHYEAVVR
jgi:hypothetical protein